MKCHIYSFFEHFQGWWHYHFPGEHIAMFNHSFSAEPFLIFLSLNLPRTTWGHFPLSCQYLPGRRSQLPPGCNSLLSGSCGEWSGSPWVSFFQTKHPQRPQLLLPEPVLWSFTISTAVLWTPSSTSVSLEDPKMSTAVEVWPHQCRVQGNLSWLGLNLPWLAWFAVQGTAI